MIELVVDRPDAAERHGDPDERGRARAFANRSVANRSQPWVQV